MSCRARPSSLSARPPPKSPAREGRRRPVHSSRGGPPPRAVNRGRCEQGENRRGAVMRSRQGVGMAAAAWHLRGFGGPERLLLPHHRLRYEDGRWARLSASAIAPSSPMSFWASSQASRLRAWTRSRLGTLSLPPLHKRQGSMDPAAIEDHTLRLQDPSPTTLSIPCHDDHAMSMAGA